MASSGPSNAAALIGVAALAAGVAAASAVKPEEVIDTVISKVSGAVVSAGYAAEDQREGQPARGFLERSVRGVGRWVDENALALQWKVNVMRFDEQSPVSSGMIVRGFVGYGAFVLAKALLRSATR